MQGREDGQLADPFRASPCACHQRQPSYISPVTLTRFSDARGLSAGRGAHSKAGQEGRRTQARSLSTHILGLWVPFTFVLPQAPPGTRTIRQGYTYDPSEQIGEGTYGQVFIGHDKNTRRKVGTSTCHAAQWQVVARAQAQAWTLGIASARVWVVRTRGRTRGSAHSWQRTSHTFEAARVARSRVRIA